MWWDQVEYLLTNTNITNIVIIFKDISLTLTLQSLAEKQIAAKQVIQLMKLSTLAEISVFLQHLSERLNVTIPVEPLAYYRAMSWMDIQEMEQHGIDFHPHTVTHPILSHLNSTEQERQIKMSNKTLQKKLNTKPNIFCYPNGLQGDFTKKTIAILKKENFIGACSSERGFFYPIKTDLFKIPRFSFPEKYYKFVLYVSGCKVLHLSIRKRLTHILDHFSKLKPFQI